MNRIAAEAPVLVIGGRTTGLMMAAELARHGISVRIVDKSPGIDPHARATVLHSRSLEILHGLGIAEPIVACAQPLHGIQIFANGRFKGRSAEIPVDSPFPYSVGLSQATTEAVLERHLHSFGLTVERNTELIALEQDADRVRATLKGADGREERVETPWLIGCDGAHSTVRHLTEDGFPGAADPHPYLLADVVVDGPLRPEDVFIFLHDDGELFLFVLNEGRRFVVANVPPQSDLSQPPTLEQVQAIVTRRGLPELRVSDPRWLAHFHIHYRLAPHYRHGRTFLAGDAAHVHSLLGGQGMNTGMQDAHNLAWKLALVIRGVVPAAWLDSYEIERRRVAEDVLAATKRATETAELYSELSPAEREKLVQHMFVPESQKMHARRHAEEIDLDYRACRLCVALDEDFPAGPPPGARADDAGPIFVSGAECTLYDLLRQPRHSLFLFAPAGAPEAWQDVARAAASAVGEHGHWIGVYLVVDRAPTAGVPQGVNVIEDRRHTLRRRYGAANGGAYLIRPDGYVGFRSRRCDTLGDYLDRVL